MHNAKLYQQNNNLQKRDAAACLKEYANKSNFKVVNNKIIDIGCGDGSVSIMIKKYIPHAITFLGCDKSETMVNFANEHHRDENTSFVVLDIEAGDLPDSLYNNFGNLFSFYTLHWVMDHKRAFNNIFNLLDQDGQCLMTLLTWSPFYDAFRIIARSNKWRTWLTDTHLYISPYHDSQEPAKEVLKLMEHIGFVDVDVTVKKMSYIYDDMEAMKRALAAIVPFNIPKDKLSIFMADLLKIVLEVQDINNLIDNHCSQDAQFNYHALIVYGRKPRADVANCHHEPRINARVKAL